MTWNQQYRWLDAGERIMIGDEVLQDDGSWLPAAFRTVGQKAPDPNCTSHRVYRRKNERTLKVGDWVVYEGKTYSFPGFISAVCHDGQLVVQAHGSEVGYRGMKHIYGRSQLRYIPPEERICQRDGCDNKGMSTADLGEGPIAVCHDCSDDLENAQISSEQFSHAGDALAYMLKGLQSKDELKEAAVSRGAGVFPAEGMGSAFTPEQFDEVIKSVTKGELLDDGVVLSGRIIGLDLADGLGETATQVFKGDDAYVCHACSHTGLLTVEHAKVVRDGYVRELYCEECKRHKPLSCFKWLVTGEDVG